MLQLLTRNQTLDYSWMTLTGELAESVHQLDSLLQLLTDLPEGLETAIPTQL